MRTKLRRYTAKQIDPSIRTGSSPIERSMVRTTQVTAYLFHAPQAHISAALIFIFSLIIGLIINFDTSNLLGNFSFISIYDNAVILGLVIIGFPALISGLISTPLAELLGGTLSYKRSFLLALFSCVILFFVLLCGRFLSLVLDVDFLIIYIFGYALIFSIRHSVLLATSNSKHLNSILCSINQSILGFAFLWLIPKTGLAITTQEFSIMFWFIAIFFIVTLLWVHIITTPFRRNFGVNGLVLMKHALSQFSKDYQAGRVLEQEFFDKIGSKSNLRVGVVCFKPKYHKNDATKNKPPVKTMMVIPSIHPGPFGVLGGSNLPKKLSRYLKQITSNLMVFHGPAVHAQDPVATSECKKIAKKVRSLVQRTEYSDTISAFHRAKLNNSDESDSEFPEQSTLTLCGQRLGNGVVYIHTSAPEPTDDIDNPTGEAIVVKGEYETKSKALFIDAHNCLVPGTGQVYFNSKKARNMLKLVTRLNMNLDDSDKFKIKIGFASDQSLKLSDGMGPMGIQVLFLSSEPIDTKSRARNYAYILFDGNNMVCGLREQILETIETYVDDAEVFTTDNHIVNATMGGYNPIGLKVNSERIIKRIHYLIRKAKKDLESCEVGVNSGIVKNIRILGKTMPMRLSTTINSTIAIMKESLIACQALAIAACWLVTVI